MISLMRSENCGICADYRAIILRRKLDLNTKNKLVDEELGFLNIIKEESGLFNTQKLFLYYYLFYLL